jgi:hypothetical protein
VVVGDAVGLATFVADNPVEGDQEYVEAPEAVKDWLEPEDIVDEEGLMDIVGKAFTVTV